MRHSLTLRCNDPDGINPGTAGNLSEIRLDEDRILIFENSSGPCDFKKVLGTAIRKDMIDAEKNFHPMNGSDNTRRG
jgi:hypothetical protein